MYCEKLTASFIDEVNKDVVAYRRHIHKHPETGFDTGRTEQFIREILEKEGIETLTSTIGVIGLIPSKNKSEKYVALRADIDALSLEEANETPYRSVETGKMHACGHDAHTAMLLGAARLLNASRDSLRHNVLLIFQPAEEGPDLGGAIIMLEDLRKQGLLPNITAITALHVTTEHNSGTIGIRYGSAMASIDTFDVTVKGRGGHGGIPYKAIDPISISAKFITAMESYMSRFVNVFDPAIFAVCMINSGTARNVIPDSAMISGQLRALSEDNREKVMEASNNLLQGLCLYTGADFDMKVTNGLPVLVNDEKTVRNAENIAKTAFGTDNVVILNSPNMGAEDFAFFARSIPAAFVWLGVRNEERGFVHMIHNPRFDIDEDALPTGVRYLYDFVYSYSEQ